MPMTCGDMVLKHLEMFPACSKIEAQARIAKAVKDNFTEATWPHLIREAKIQTVAPLSDGTLAVTSGSASVTLSDAAWDTSWANRRIKILGASEIYALTIASATTGTLDAPFTGPTATDATYQMYLDIYPLPADCNYGRECALYDPVLNVKLDFTDLPTLMRVKFRRARIVGVPAAFARYAIDPVTGGAQIILGPDAPSEVRSYSFFYYAAPAAFSDAMVPDWPESFEDLHNLRAAWEYASDPKHPHFMRSELRQSYYLRRSQMKRMTEGRSEMDRHIKTTYPRWQFENVSMLRARDPIYGF